MYRLHEKVTISKCDPAGRLSLHAALQMMQDCSELWLDSEPAVRDAFDRLGMAQILVSRQVEILRVPHCKEDLTVETSVWDVKPMFGYRNTFIYDTRGLPCYRTWSMGAFIDRATGKLRRADAAALSAMHLEPRLDMTYTDRRIPVPSAPGTPMPPVPVRPTDIDYNRHMNNANYVRIAMELLPEGFEVTDMRVEYRIAAKLGDLLTPTLYPIDGGYIVALAIDTQPSAIIELLTRPPEVLIVVEVVYCCSCCLIIPRLLFDGFNKRLYLCGIELNHIFIV